MWAAYTENRFGKNRSANKASVCACSTFQQRCQYSRAASLQQSCDLPKPRNSETQKPKAVKSYNPHAGPNDMKEDDLPAALRLLSMF